MTLAALVRRKIQQFGPYRSLALLFVPLLMVEPLKIAGLAFAGLGHWVAGACMIVGAYAGGPPLSRRKVKTVDDEMVCGVGNDMGRSAQPGGRSDRISTTSGGTGEHRVTLRSRRTFLARKFVRRTQRLEVAA
jgi:hypothetical protein